MARSDTKKQDGLASDIRRQFGDRATKRFARALPAFKVVTDIPDHLRVLLEQLERAERSAGGSRR